MSDDSYAIELSKVCVRRGTTKILDGIDWSVRRGEAVAVLGPNGSGKTTLMRVLTGYMWATTGSVAVLGETFGRTDLRALRRRISVVDPAERFGVDANLSVIDAVKTGYLGTLILDEFHTITPEQADHAEHMVNAVGLAHRRGAKFGVLSTGERRRCLLARALVHLPEVLILDEPTAGLDISGREHLLATIEQLRRQHPLMTTVLVTHHVEEIAPGTDQVMLLSEGRVAAAGAPDTVITPETLSATFGCKVFVQRRNGRWWLEVLPEAWLDLLAGD